MKALVMGGGMAGLCAAADLCDFGVEVHLVEATDILGGRATSWMDADGDTVDNALHIFMPHYCNCLGFLTKVGAEPLHWTQGITNYDERGRCGLLPIGGGLGTLLRAMRSPTMSVLDQASLGFAVLVSALMSKERLDACDEITLLEWFKRHGVTRNAIAHFRPGGAGLTFLELNQVSAKALLYWTSSFVNREYMLNPGIGFANGGLGEIYVEPARRYIEARGGRVETGRRVTELLVRGNEVEGTVAGDGETLKADLYISAMPHYELRRVLPDEALDYPYFLDLWRLQEAPSVSVQIWFDRFVTDMRNIAAQMRGTFNCFADMHTIVPRFASTATGSMVEFVLTPAFHLRGLPPERIYAMTLEEFRRIMPAAREAEVRKWVVTRERQGIFAQRPGADAFRPPQRTPYPNLYLCGDYTKTFISAGMENACASAHLAVGHALYEHLGREVTLFSQPTAYDAYLKRGLAAGAALGGAALAARLLRAGRGREGGPAGG